MKILSIILVFLLQMTSSTKQNVSWKDIKFKHKKGFLIVEGENRFQLKWSAGYYYISDLQSGEEQFYIHLNNNETIQYVEDDYRKVYFTGLKTFYETKQHHKIILERMINEGVITSDWKIDQEKVPAFIKKYDENITERTVR